VCRWSKAINEDRKHFLVAQFGLSDPFQECWERTEDSRSKEDYSESQQLLTGAEDYNCSVALSHRAQSASQKFPGT